MEEKKKIRIQTRVNEEEYQLILKHAYTHKQSISEYIKTAALQNKGKKKDYEILRNLMHVINKLTNEVNRLVITILGTGQYFPSDLEKITKRMEEITLNQKEILMQFSEVKTSKKRKVKAKEIVKNWREDNLDKNKTECHKETGISPKTISKWWGD